MFSSAPMRLRSALLVFGIGLGLSGLWMLLPELPRPKPAGLPFDRNGAGGAAARRSRAVLAAEIGVIRGVFWADAFTGARFMRTDRSTCLGWTNSGQFARARANTETALALAPVNGAAALFLARRFAAPSALDLAPGRLERAATSSTLTNKDLQAFIKSDIRAVLDRGPEFQQAMMAADRNAWPRNQPIFKSLVADADPAAAQLLPSG
ncbi:MAG: hypothetical protein WBF43_06785, partial [Methylocella sp.]